MRAESTQSESFDYRRAGFQRCAGGIGEAAEGIVQHLERQAQLAVDRLRVRAQGARRRLGLEWREAPLEHELYVRLGQQFLLDALAQLPLDTVVVGDPGHAHV